jgi:hypothetical protein
MKQIIDGKSFNTDTAICLCELECRYYPGDYGHHDTKLYRTKKGAYFVAGSGGPASMWARPAGNNGWTGGSGIRPVSKSEAMRYAEGAELSEEQMSAAGFEIAEA